MPNWCMNTVTFEGTEQQIKKIKKAVDKEELFDSFYPIPKALRETVSGSESAKPDWQKENSGQLIMKHGADNWYDWCTTNWGTKWDACDLSVLSEGTHDVTIGFSSAWSPGIGFYQHLFETMNKNVDDMGDPKFKIKATYYEPGCDFIGIWENGYDVTYTLSDLEDNFFENDADGKMLEDDYGILENRAEDRATEKEEVQQWYEEGKEDLKLA